MADLETVGLCLLLEKPAEPLIVPKGDDDLIFEMPQNFYSSKYRKNYNKIKQKFDVKDGIRLKIKNISIPVDLINEAAQIQGSFSLFVPRHLDIATMLINEFMSAETITDLLSLATYCRERLHPVLFNYALTVAILHREDTKDLSLPNFLECFPGRFIKATAFSDVRTQANMLNADSRTPIIIKKNFTATNREPEQAVAYFREDMGINLHHWHWHLVYPTRGSPEVLNKDRRGELFYYMHEQVLARYNTERLCNNMEMVKSLSSLRDSIKEAYFPKLTQLNSNREWSPRTADVYLSDIYRPSDRLSLEIGVVEDWMEAIRQAIRDGRVTDDNGNTIDLDPVSGIDILGNMVESSELSVNRDFYGNVHNMGHVLISFCHDPEDRFLEGYAVMADVATAMRDPVFYRWHNTINDLFVEHKRKLPPYTFEELNFQGVTIADISVQSPGKPLNELNTFWEFNDIDINGGLDFVPKGAMPIRITYLQHGQFTYTVLVNNASNRQVLGTMRIFMSPKYNLSQNIHMFEIERQLMIEMDKFTVTLKPGSNTIERNSSDSSVTIKYETTYKSVANSGNSTRAIRQNNFCGCGWPDNMLIPKGTKAGFKMNLFAMVSDYTVDRVVQSPADVCPGADSYCGLFNRKYPDNRCMGYPFDRPAADGVDHLPDFLIPNMKVVEVTIKHNNVDIVRPPPTNTGPAVVGN